VISILEINKITVAWQQNYKPIW